MYILKDTFLILLVVFCQFSTTYILSAQELNGIIKDKESGEVLVGALVNSAEEFTISNIDGSFKFLISPEMDTIFISFLGYMDHIVLVREVNFGQKLIVEMEAENTFLDATVVVGSRFEQRLAESSVSIERISPRLLENSNAINPESVLDKIPGISMKDGQANIRGGSGYSYGAGSRVLLLVDDIPALQSDAGSPNWDDIGIENVESIEILKGAASALYGSSALNGIINIRSAKVGLNPETQISASFRHYNSPAVDSLRWWDSKTPYEWKFNIAHKQRFGKLDLIGSAYYLDRLSFNKDTYRTYGRAIVNMQYRLSDDMTLRLNSNFNRGKSGSYFYWKGTGALYEGDTSTLTKTEYTRYNIDPQWIWYQKNDLRHNLKARFYSVSNVVPRGRSNHSSLSYIEYNLQKKWNEAELVMNTGITGFHTASEAELYGDTSYFSQNLAIFGQLEKKLGSKLNLSGGFRYELNRLNSPEVIFQDSLVGGTDIESRPVFRFGLNYEIGPYSFLRASWGQGYRYPTIAEKYVATDLGIVFLSPNPLLESETGWNVEIGIRQGFSVKKMTGFIDVSLFRSEYHNMMEFIFTGFVQGFQSQNTGDTRIQGLDLSLGMKGRLGDVEVNGIGGITLLDPKYQQFTSEDSLRSSVDYNILKYRNKRNAKFDVEAIYKQVTFGIAYNHSSHMEAIDGVFESFISGLKAYRTEFNTGHHVWDARLSYTLGKMKFSLLFENMFNEMYTVRPALMEAPSNISLRYDLKF